MSAFLRERVSALIDALILMCLLAFAELSGISALALVFVLVLTISVAVRIKKRLRVQSVGHIPQVGTFVLASRTFA
jgi:hypothetical protein